MTIKVCDSIMGSGKSSAVIKYMNDHPEKHYIYITPFLKEAERIMKACPSLQFEEPDRVYKQRRVSKYNGVHDLLIATRNIATTHAMFVRLGPELIDLIRSGHYTLIVDEMIGLFKEVDIFQCDWDTIHKLGWVDDDGKSLVLSNGIEYERGACLDSIYSLLRNGSLDQVEKGGSAGYWAMSDVILRAFDEVLVLTYQFSAQTMAYYMQMKGLEFSYVGVLRNESGEYEFCENGAYIPAYCENLSEKIHIFENEKINRIGDKRTALSCSWFNTNEGGVDTLARNIQNFFKNYNPTIPAKFRLWSVFNGYVTQIRKKGFYNSNLAFNARATNEYSHCRALAYCVNIFVNPNERRFFAKHGVSVNEDGYALSTMIQWIWRSAIRNGEEIWIYIPSKRMRDLLTGWIASVEAQYREFKTNGVAALPSVERSGEGQ